MSLISSLTKPPALKSGDTIGIVSTAKYLEKKQLMAAAARLEKLGYNAVVPEANFKQFGIFAGDDAHRLKALHAAFEDPSINAIMCARGGVGTHRIVDLVDFDLIAENPKIFCGFSDLTYLLHAIMNKSRLVTYHGVMMTGLADKSNPVSTSTLMQVFSGDTTKPYNFGPDDGVKCVTAGHCSGPLIGGNLAIMSTLIGTEHDFVTDDCILFLEDVGEELYNIDRLLNHLKRAGKFDRINGVIFGEIDMLGDALNYGSSLREVLEKYFKPLGIPVVMDYPCGHGKRISMMPMGISATLDVTEQETSLAFNESTVHVE